MPKIKTKIKRKIISIDGEQIDNIKRVDREDLKGYGETKLVRIALQEWLRENIKIRANDSKPY